MTASSTTVTFPADDGVQLEGDLWLPGGASAAAPVPAVVMSHCPSVSGECERATSRSS